VSTHSVQQHLQVSGDGYDVAIRAFVPHYDEMLQTAVALLGELAPPSPRVLDLGGGTGALTEAIARGLPAARVELVDIDPQMLAQARARLAWAGERVRVREASFHDPLPPCDVVAASLSLHHVHDLELKTRLYGSILGALAPGGVFLNLDATVSDDARLAALTYERWVVSMGEHGIAPDVARGHLADWSREDRYFALHEELAALARAGFARPECFWRRGPVAIYGGLRG
jgi:tRNA (cmo5U34)-methyltransferase